MAVCTTLRLLSGTLISLTLSCQSHHDLVDRSKLMAPQHTGMCSFACSLICFTAHAHLTSRLRWIRRVAPHRELPLKDASISRRPGRAGRGRYHTRPSPLELTKQQTFLCPSRCQQATLLSPPSASNSHGWCWDRVLA